MIFFTPMMKMETRQAERMGMTRRFSLMTAVENLPGWSSKMALGQPRKPMLMTGRATGF